MVKNLDQVIFSENFWNFFKTGLIDLNPSPLAIIYEEATNTYFWSLQLLCTWFKKKKKKSFWFEYSSEWWQNSPTQCPNLLNLFLGNRKLRSMGRPLLHDWLWFSKSTREGGSLELNHKWGHDWSYPRCKKWVRFRWSWLLSQQITLTCLVQKAHSDVAVVHWTELNIKTSALSKL